MEIHNPDNLTSPNSFIKKFHLSKNGFSTAVQLKDHQYGFTTTKPYKNIWKNNKEYYSFVSLVVNYPNKESNPRHSRVIAHIDLTEKRDGQYYVTESLQKVVAKPINMNSIDDYWVNLKTGKFYNNNGQEVKAEQMLTALYNLHLKPTKKLGGLGIRTRLRLWQYTIGLLKYLEIVAKYLLVVLTGEFYKYDHFGTMMRSRETDRKFDTKPEIKTENISISGFTARPHTILAYCGIHLLLFLICYSRKQYPPVLVSIFTNSFLTIIYTVFTLGVMDRVYPPFSKWLQRKLAKLQWTLNFRSFKL